MGNEAVDVKPLRQSAAPATPFTILCWPIQTLTGEIDTGNEFEDVTLPHAVAATGNALVILNAASCWLPPLYSQDGDATIAIAGTDTEEGTVNLVTGALSATSTFTNDGGVGSINSFNLAADNASTAQSFGGWFEWIDEETIRVHRAGSCTECFNNCVAFTLQIVEFCPDVIQQPS